MTASWPCLVIAGPTASGKTALAVEVAHRLGSEIFSMDSRQVYRGLDLGTGKDLSEYTRFSPPVRHHLIDIVDPEQVYSLFRFQVDAYVALDTFLGQHGPEVAPVLAGGTGLYLEAVLKRYAIAEVPENAALREELMARDARALREELKAVSPELYERTDLSSKKRVVRALEIATTPRGAIPPSRLPEWSLNPLIFVTRPDRATLRARIAKRLRERLDAGLVDEVRGLRARGVSWERLALLGMEYRQVAAHLRGELGLEEMTGVLLHQIHLLAKRQETYFRGMERRGLAVHWIDDPENFGAADVIARYDAWKSAGYPSAHTSVRPADVTTSGFMPD
jgi:tRNA dimethylallyltransferase